MGLVVIIKEVCAKTILSKSKVLDYSVNPYIGCEHSCTYCYAQYMKRFSGHKEDWGKFVDVKINAGTLLQHDIRKKKIGRVWISGTCDPYQPLEKKYELTRECLEILSAHNWPITIQTKSPLVKRDLDLLRKVSDIEIGLTITTADQTISKMFEPHSPSINERIETVEKLKASGLKTFVMIAPILPKAEGLSAQLNGKVDTILIDKMNYHYADWVYKNNGLEYANTQNFFAQKKEELANAFSQKKIPCQILF